MIKQLISLASSKETSTNEKQKLLENLMYKSIEVLNFDAFTNIVEGSNLQKMLNSFEEKLELSLKEENSF